MSVNHAAEQPLDRTRLELNPLIEILRAGQFGVMSLSAIGRIIRRNIPFADGGHQYG